MTPIHVTDANFQKEVVNSDVPVLVDFFATWCGPCQALAPVLEELDAEANGKYKICKVDIDEQPVLAEQYSIMSVPTLFVIKNGRIADSVIGARSKNELLAMLQA